MRKRAPTFLCVIRPRLIAAIIMLHYVAACTAWRVQEAAPQDASELRVTLADGRRLLLRDAQMMGDSLVGFAVQRPVNPSARVRLAFPTADLQRIEVSRLDAGKTSLAVITLGAMVALVIALGNIQTTDPNH